MATTTPPRKHGLATSEKSDPIGYAVAALNRLAQSDLLDRLGLRKTAEQAVFTATRTGFSTLGTVSRGFKKVQGSGSGTRTRPANPAGVFDLTPTEDEQMLVDVVKDFADEVLRPAASAADDACAAPQDVLAAVLEIGLPILGVPEELGGISEERSTMAGVLVAEQLARGDMGLAVASLAAGAVSTALGLYGDESQQKTYLPAFTGEDVPAAALALSEPAMLFDAMQPATTASRQGDGFVLRGIKSMVPRAADAELFVIGAMLEGRPALFLVEGGTRGLTIESDPGMGVRAAGMGRVVFDDVEVGAISLLGSNDGETYREAVKLSRLAWCALAVGTGQAVLDYVIPYVKEREAFGEPIAHRQSVAFMVANIQIELQGMRLLTYKAASRAAQGKDFTRAVALAHKVCNEKGMQIGLDGVQLLGGHGFVKEHPVERWYRDLRAIGCLEGAVLV